MYLLRFKTGSEITPHIDKVTSGKHYRLNIVLKPAKLGGEFVCINPIYETKLIKFFRPDISVHSVTKVIIGTRYLVSLGWIKNEY